MRKTTRSNRDKILLAATRIIRQKGVANTSLADIAREVDISKGTLYYYYSSKSDLIFDITEKHMSQMTQAILDWVKDSKEGTSAREILLIVFQILLKGRTRGPVHLYLIQEAITDNDSLRERFRAAYSKWRSILQEGLEQILRGEKNYEVLSTVILAMIDGLLLQKLIGIDELPLRDIADFFTVE